MSGLRLLNVRKAFGASVVLEDINLEVGEGEFVVFVGPSGCGKSTLLRLIAGLEEITSGEIWIGSRLVNDVVPAQRGVAMVFQSYALYPHMTVQQNMAFALKLARVSQSDIDAAVRNAARKLEIEQLLCKKPRMLSGGQRQRVAIGRAIVRNPRVFLFDEPLSNLDAGLRASMRLELAKLHKELKTTMVYVTHDQIEAMTLAQRIVVLSAGRIEQIGTPMELYRGPANLFVAGFIGSPKMNFLSAQIAETGPRNTLVRLVPSGELISVARRAPEAKTGQQVTLGIRPEHLEPGATSNKLCLSVQSVEAIGSATLAYATLAGAPVPIVMQIPGDFALQTGETLRVGVSPQACHLFDASGRALPLLIEEAEKSETGSFRSYH